MQKAEVIRYAVEKKLLIDDAAAGMLWKHDDWKEIVDELAEAKEFMLSKGKVEDYLAKRETKLNMQEVIVRKSGPRPASKEHKANFRILKEYDITGQSSSEGKVEDFLNYFRDKYKFLSELLSRRIGFNPKKLSELGRLAKNEEIDLVCMVNKKWVTKNEHWALQIEDLESRCIAVISKNKPQLFEEVEHVLLDNVIGLRAIKLSNDMVLVNEILLPDLPQRSFRCSDEDVAIASISDTHIGSKLFMEKEFAEFIDWLNGKGISGKEKELVGKIKYLAVVGDNIDGVGIYPDQYDELAIKDVYEQYDKFTEYMKLVPEHIQVVICPGQHDAVRRADPQPAIPKEYVKELSGYSNMHFVGSPSWFEVEGLKAIMYHGAAMHDMYASVNFLSAKEPQKALVEALKKRDLMAGYGQRNPYVPEKKDYMLIREPPDIYFGGDMHHYGYANYRGCIVINNSTWQSRTEFQVAQGHVPTPGIVPILELKTGKLTEKKFCAGDEGNG